jgi:CheY-like chemotaxis protein
MARLLTTTADLVRHSMNVEVSVDIDPADEGLVALADQNQLQQVLVNLCLNSRDAMPPGATQPLEFRLRHRLLIGELSAFPQNVPAGDYVVLDVEDRGSGMSQTVLAQALDPFFTTKDVGQGTGLGLPVAFGIVHGHQGLLTLKSEVGRGTCVSIFLPRLAEPGEVSAPADRTHVLEPEATPRRQILVVDDEEAVRDVVCRFLEIAGHQVVCVKNGAEALASLRGEPLPDLVILDLMIPKEDGAANFRAIRAAHPQVPILLCTGLVQMDLAQQLLQEGAADLLRKPFRMNELWYMVNKAVAG